VSDEDLVVPSELTHDISCAGPINNPKTAPMTHPIIDANIIKIK